MSFCFRICGRKIEPRPRLIGGGRHAFKVTRRRLSVPESPWTTKERRNLRVRNIPQASIDRGMHLLQSSACGAF